jgi:hypothetical protein
MLHPNIQNIKNLNPSARLNEADLNSISLKFGSFISMSQNKCLNHITTLSIIMKNSSYKKIFMLLAGSDNIYELIQSYIDNTPNLYKKVAKKILFK